MSNIIATPSTEDFVSSGLLRAKDTMLNIFKGSNIYLIIFLIILFIGIAFYVYTNYISPIIKPGYIANNELNNNKSKDNWSLGQENETPFGKSGSSKKVSKNDESNEEKSTITLWYFYTKWCPYCKKARPEWDKLKQLYPDNTVRENGYSLKFEEINGETDANMQSWFEETYLKDSEKDKIDGYPSIYLVKNNEVFEYEAIPKLSTFQIFIKQVAYN